MLPSRPTSSVSMAHLSSLFLVRRPSNWAIHYDDQPQCRSSIGLSSTVSRILSCTCSNMSYSVNRSSPVPATSSFLKSAPEPLHSTPSPAFNQNKINSIRNTVPSSPNSYAFRLAHRNYETPEELLSAPFCPSHPMQVFFDVLVIERKALSERHQQFSTRKDKRATAVLPKITSKFTNRLLNQFLVRVRDAKESIELSGCGDAISQNLFKEELGWLEMLRGLSRTGTLGKLTESDSNNIENTDSIAEEHLLLQSLLSTRPLRQKMGAILVDSGDTGLSVCEAVSNKESGESSSCFSKDKSDAVCFNDEMEIWACTFDAIRKLILLTELEASTYTGWWESAFLALQELMEDEAATDSNLKEGKNWRVSDDNNRPALLAPKHFTQVMQACAEAQQYEACRATYELARRRYLSHLDITEDANNTSHVDDINYIDFDECNEVISSSSHPSLTENMTSLHSIWIQNVAKSVRSVSQFHAFRKLFQDPSVHRNIPVTVPLYGAIIRACERCIGGSLSPQFSAREDGATGRLEFATSLYRTLRDNQLTPDVDIYASLIGICAIEKQTTTAFGFFCEMRVLLEKKLELSRMGNGAILGSGDVVTSSPPPGITNEEGLQINPKGLFAQLIGTLPSRVYANLLRSYITGGYPEDALATFQVLREAGAPLDRLAYHVVLSGCKSPRDAYLLVEEMVAGSLGNVRGAPLKTRSPSGASSFNLHSTGIDPLAVSIESSSSLEDYLHRRMIATTNSNDFDPNDTLRTLMGQGLWQQDGAGEGAIPLQPTPTTFGLLVNVQSAHRRGSQTILSLFDLHQHVLLYVAKELYNKERDQDARDKAFTAIRMRLASGAADKEEYFWQKDVTSSGELEESEIHTHSSEEQKYGKAGFFPSPKKNQNQKSLMYRIHDILCNFHMLYVRSLEHALFSVKVDLVSWSLPSYPNNRVSSGIESKQSKEEESYISVSTATGNEIPSHLEKYFTNGGIKRIKKEKFLMMSKESSSPNSKPSKLLPLDAQYKKENPKYYADDLKPADIPSLRRYAIPLIRLVQHDMTVNYLKNVIQPQRPTTFEPILSGTDTTHHHLPMITVRRSAGGSVDGEGESNHRKATGYGIGKNKTKVPIVAVMTAEILANIDELFIPFIRYFSSIVIPFSQLVSLRREGGAVSIDATSSVRKAISQETDGFALTDLFFTSIRNNNSISKDGIPLHRGDLNELSPDQTAERAQSHQSRLIEFFKRYSSAIHLMSLEEELAMSVEARTFNIPLSSNEGRAVLVAGCLSQGLPSLSTRVHNRNTSHSGSDVVITPAKLCGAPESYAVTPSIPYSLYRDTNAHFYVVSTDFKNCGRHIVENEAFISSGRSKPITRKVRWLNPRQEPNWQPPVSLSIVEHLPQHKTEVKEGPAVIKTKDGTILTPRIVTRENPAAPEAADITPDALYNSMVMDY